MKNTQCFFDTWLVLIIVSVISIWLNIVIFISPHPEWYGSENMITGWYTMVHVGILVILVVGLIWVCINDASGDSFILIVPCALASILLVLWPAVIVIGITAWLVFTASSEYGQNCEKEQEDLGN